MSMGVRGEMEGERWRIRGRAKGDERQGNGGKW